MISRFNLLLGSYLQLETAETWDETKKIRTMLKLLELWDELAVPVDLH